MTLQKQFTLFSVVFRQNSHISDVTMRPARFLKRSATIHLNALSDPHESSFDKAVQKEISKEPTVVAPKILHCDGGKSSVILPSAISTTSSAVPFGSYKLLPLLPNCAFYCTTATEDPTNPRSSPPSVYSTLTPTKAILVPPIPLSLKHGLQVATGLSKFRLSLLVVSTAVVGCALAASTNLTSPLFAAYPYRTVLSLTVGTGLTSAAANAINQIVEIPYDSQMLRTRNRVLVRGLTNPGRAGLFALGCAGTGLTVLYLGVNPLVAWLAAGNLLLYTSVYTPMKQFSQANTWFGSLVGGVPPLMGWAAATGEIHSGSLFLASLLYVWQFPHFMALSWNLRDEYSKGGYMMTSVLEPDVCKQVTLRYAVASSLVCLAGAGCSAISLGPWAGCALGLACLPPNIGLIYYAWQFYAADSPETSSAAARRLFRSTLLHLPVVMTAALIGTYICQTAIDTGS